MRKLLIGFLASGCFVAAAPAQPMPSTQPGMRMRAPDYPRWMSREEQSEVEDFARDHMKNLLALSNQSPPIRQQRLLRYASARMHALLQTRTNPSVFGRLIRDIESEDEVFAFISDLEGAAPADRPALREKIRAKMREIVDHFLDERAQRIELLKTRLDDEQKRLQDDRANRDQIVDQRVDRFMKEIPLDSPDTSAGDAPTTAPATQQ